VGVKVGTIVGEGSMVKVGGKVGLGKMVLVGSGCGAGAQAVTAMDRNVQRRIAEIRNLCSFIFSLFSYPLIASGAKQNCSAPEFYHYTLL